MTVNALNDPILGQLSDQTNREKWGSRRIIYIKYGGPIWGLTFLLLWFPWSLDNQIVIFIHYVISICLFDTMFTLITIVWNALLPVMTIDIDERNKANFLTLLIGAIAVVPFLFILGPMKPISQAFQFLVLYISIISTTFLFLVVKMCEERPEFQKDESFPLWRSIKETTKSKTFLLFMGYNFFNIFTGSIGISYLFLYILILGNNESVIIWFFLIFVIFGYSSYIVCLILRPIWGMRRVILRFGLIRVIMYIIIFILLLLFPIDPLIWLIWIGFIFWTFFGGYQVYTMGSLMYLSVDEDEINHGTRREGMFLGMNALFTKPAVSFGPIIATLILAYFGYIQGADVQPASALIGIKILFFLIPAIATAVSLIFIYYYPLHDEKLMEMSKKLTLLHREKITKVQTNSK
jgi:GPH family glycoside/pentoside/hexuronide:cation symporter